MTDTEQLNELAARVERRLTSFGSAVDSLPFASAALAKGYQFNAYDSASNSDGDEDQDCEMLVCLGPITDAHLVCQVTGRATAELIADALTLAASLRALAKGTTNAD